MQFQTLAATAFFAALAAAAPQAQQGGGLIAGLPTCALPCFQEGSVKVGCTAGDFACVCTKLDAFTKESAGCIAAACKPEDLLRQDKYQDANLIRFSPQTALQSASTQLCKAALAGASSSSAAAPAAPSATASASAPAKASASATASASASAPAKASSSASASAPAAATPSASGTPKTAGGSRAEAGAMLAVAAVVAMAL
ncbi:hypothetical protein PG990_010952 [Apiospora arundinis]